MKIFCGFSKAKKPRAVKKPAPEPENPIPSRIPSTVLTQKSPKVMIDISKLECFRTNELVLNNYHILEKIGGGSFGEIFKVQCITSSQVLAMKIEKKRPEKNLLLLRERQILLELQNEFGFPHLSAFIKGDIWSYMIMSHLGDNLENLRKKMNNKFSLKTVLMIGYQLMERIENLHSKNFLHRDIKPENFVIGSGENYKTIYIIDFGLSKAFIENNEHIPFRDKKGMVGTARYASINTHLGYEQSRRDDLEGIGYILVYFAKGRLPWQNIYAKTKEQKYAQILSSKQKVTTESLCSGLPQEFIRYFDYVRTLDFTAKPDYKYLKKLFLTMLKNGQFKLDYEFDWLALYSRNSNSNSSMDMRDDEHKGNKIRDYFGKNKNPNNIEMINMGSAKKLKKENVSPESKICRNDKNSSLTSSNKNTYNEWDLKEEECDQVRIQETYNTMKPKLIRNSMKRLTKEEIMRNLQELDNKYPHTSEEYSCSAEQEIFEKIQT